MQLNFEIGRLTGLGTVRVKQNEVKLFFRVNLLAIKHDRTDRIFYGCMTDPIADRFFFHFAVVSLQGRVNISTEFSFAR